MATSATEKTPLRLSVSQMRCGIGVWRGKGELTELDLADLTPHPQLCLGVITINGTQLVTESWYFRYQRQIFLAIIW